MRKFLILPLLLPMLALSQQICGRLVEGAKTAEEARSRAAASLAQAINSKGSFQSNWEEIITGRKSEQRDTTRTRTEAELLNAQAAKHTDGKDKNGYSSQACMSYADAAQPYLNYLIGRAGRLKNAVLALGGKSGKKEAWDNVVSIYETLKGLEGVLIPLGQMDYALQKEYEADYAKAKKEYEAFFVEQSGRGIYLEVKGTRTETINNYLREVISENNCRMETKSKSNGFTLKVTASDCNQKNDGDFDHCGSCAKIELVDGKNKKSGYTGNVTGRGSWDDKETACEKAATDVTKEIWSKVAGKLTEACE